MEEIRKEIESACKTNDFFNSQYLIEEAKKKYTEKEIKSYLRKEIKRRKAIEKEYYKQINIVDKKYKDRNCYLWEEALNYVTHKFKKGEYVFFYHDGIQCGKVMSLTKRGYKIFIGRKIGIQPEISHTKVICHVSNVRVLEQILKERK